VLLSFASPKAMRYPLLTALFLALAAISPFAQQTACTVRGKVVDAITRQPIARALVQLGDDATLTDANGKFEFTGIRTEEATILVRRPGYVSNNQNDLAPSQDQISSYFVAFTPSMAPLEFLLTPEAILIGQITLLNSGTAAGVQVSVYRKAVENGRQIWKINGIATTNGEGVFRVANLAAGTYLLYAQPPANPFNVISNKVLGFASAYFPGVTDASGAGLIILASGEHKEVDMTLPRRAFYSVNIRIANAEPGNLVSLDVQDASGRRVNTGTNYDFPKQTARMDLPDGRYVLNVHMLNLVGSRQSQSLGHAEFSVSGRPTYLSVSILPMQSIPITIRKEFTTSDTGAPVRLARSGPNNPGINLTFVPADADFPGTVFGDRIEPVPGSNDGTSYQIKGIPPGKYWVNADTFEGYISSITSGGDDLSRNPLTIDAGGSSVPIEIVLRNDTGSLDGAISMSPNSIGGQMPHAWIYAIPLFSIVSQLPSTVSSSAGRFTFDHLPPGSYRVLACDSPQVIEFHTSAGIAAWEGRGQVVTIHPGSADHIQLDLTQTAERSQ